MRVIPVIDIMNGLVVRARMGDRAAYRPIETPLSPTAAPADVAAGLLALHPFGRLYVADLDGIEGRPRNDAVVAALAATHPGLEVWVDNGLADQDALAAFAAATGCRPVLGTESGLAPETPRALPGAVLSLDFRADRPVGDPRLFEDAALWPEDVIVMTLARVGSGAGPDFDRLGEIVARAGPLRRVHAAGGVRDAADLRRLAAAGVAAALVATALHDGRLNGAALAAIEGR